MMLRKMGTAICGIANANRCETVKVLKFVSYILYIFQTYFLFIDEIDFHDCFSLFQSQEMLQNKQPPDAVTNTRLLHPAVGTVIPQALIYSPFGHIIFSLRPTAFGKILCDLRENILTLSG